MEESVSFCRSGFLILYRMESIRTNFPGFTLKMVVVRNCFLFTVSMLCFIINGIPEITQFVHQQVHKKYRFISTGRYQKMTDVLIHSMNTLLTVLACILSSSWFCSLVSRSASFITCIFTNNIDLCFKNKWLVRTVFFYNCSISYRR